MELCREKSRMEGGQAMEYRIQELAAMAGISTRTLRYYDQIDLLKPLRTTPAGYRVYGQAEVDRLQQILFYREFGVELKSIAALLAREDYDRREALLSHRRALLAERSRLSRLIRNLDKTIQETEGTTIMKDRERFDGFKKALIQENEEKYGAEVREKYGDKSIDESNRKMMNLTEEQYARLQALAAEIKSRLEAAVTEGADPAGEEGQAIAVLHKEWLTFTWPSYSKEAHAGLAQMYVDDERFTAYYDNQVSGCARFIRDAVKTFTS